MPGEQLSSTHKDQVIYLHVMDPALKEIILPMPQGVKATRVSVLGGKNVRYDNGERKLKITPPDRTGNDLPYVLKIRINKQASQLSPITLPSTQ